MLFNSYEFIFLFLPITFFVYATIGKLSSRRFAIIWLIASSLFFYGWWNPAYLGLIIASMLFNYLIGAAMLGTSGYYKSKIILIVGVTVNLSVLAYFKYADFFVDNINDVFSVSWNVGNIILPLAISFFTFQQITYLIDTYRGETKEYSFVNYALFVSFFPQLIAGPIVHHREMMPQFSSINVKSINYDYIAVGLTIFFFGLFKKVVIADSMSPYAIETFAVVSQGDMLSLFEAWKGVLSYTFQLYFDFSGYSDMAVGSALLFGIRLPINFNSPYKSKNIIEFWRRWHMTLSRFLKDYLYIPLGGNRKGSLRRYSNIMITMLLGGLWHGAGWTFVIWGGLHGFYLIINHAWKSSIIAVGITIKENFFLDSLSRLVTFTAVIIAWTYFRAADLESANLMVKSLFGYGGVVWPEEASYQFGMLSTVFQAWGLRYQYLEHFNGMEHVILMVSLLMFVWLSPNIHQLFTRTPAVMESLEPSVIAWHPNKWWACITVIIAVISILKLGYVSEFLYFQF